jgi:hypothetical protein
MNLKGFILDVMWNICIVFGIGYMGGSLVALSQLEKPILDELLPIDLNKSPYVGDPAVFDLLGYSFPYNLYTQGETDFFVKVMNWLIMTCALVFVGIRKLFRSLSSFHFTGLKKMVYDFFIFYIAPLLLVSFVMNATAWTSTIVILIVLFSTFFGEFILKEKTMKNGWWYALAPLSFWFTVFFAKSEPGLMNLFLKIFLGFIAMIAGFFVMTLVYPLWWSGIATVGIFYFTFLLFFSPFWFGTFDKVIKEMGKYRISLLCVFMLLTIYSSVGLSIPLATAGIVAGSIYMLYLLFKNNKNEIFSAFKNNVKK